MKTQHASFCSSLMMASPVTHKRSGVRMMHDTVGVVIVRCWRYACKVRVKARFLIQLNDWVRAQCERDVQQRIHAHAITQAQGAACAFT